MILVVNLQRKVRLETKQFKDFCTRLLNIVEEALGQDFSVAFVSDHRMKELNKFFRGRDSTTDVLSFPHEADVFPSQAPASTDAAHGLGDIVISTEQAKRQAEEYNLTLENEIKQLILHGLLHLCGQDHETDNGEMNKRELELRAKLGIS
jgi:probable rRNA maturation factor